MCPFSIHSFASKLVGPDKPVIINIAVEVLDGSWDELANRIDIQNYKELMDDQYFHKFIRLFKDFVPRYHNKTSILT